MKVLFVVPYPFGEAPSQRFRLEHYLEYLSSHGITYKYASFWDSSTWNILYKPGYQFKKITGLLKGFLKRLFLIFSLPAYGVVFVHREATPLGPAWFEWIAAYIFRKKLIYDFDDAIWIPVVSKNNKIIKAFRNFGKVKKICKWAALVVTGNAYLAEYASQYNTKVKIIPTVVDTGFQHSRLQEQQTMNPNIGWTGSFSTLKYLDIVLPVLQELESRYDFTFIVIADKDPLLPLKNYRFIQWNKDTEADDLLSFHIGIMPLYDDAISRGKCGFKAIQYMSLGIPAVVSPVGVNTVIVDDGINGFVGTTETDWKTKLEQLLMNPLLRQQMGIDARKKIESNYSVKATAATFLDLFA